MKNTLQLITFIALLFFIGNTSTTTCYTGGSQQLNQNKDTLSTSKTWSNIYKVEYSFSYPSGWSLDTSGLMNSSFFILSPLSSSNDTFRENINLIIQDLKGLNIDLDMYTSITLKQLKTLITDYSIDQSTRITSDTLNGSYHKITYTSTQGVYNLKLQQRWWVKNGKAYVLTFTCEEDQYDKFVIKADQAMDSFLILN